MMKTSDAGVYFLAAQEGVVPGPYLDSAGVWTYGIGHAQTSGLPPCSKTMARGMPDDLDAELQRVFEVFRKDLATYEAEVRAAITVPVEQHEFDAAVSFHFNTGAIARATWVQTLNDANSKAAANQILNWSKPPEIIPRRTAEQTLFATGDYGGGVVTVWGVTDAGRVVWKPERTLTQADVKGYLAPRSEAPPPLQRRLLAFILNLFGRRA